MPGGAGIRGPRLDRINLDSDVPNVPEPLLRIFDEAPLQHTPNRRGRPHRKRRPVGLALENFRDGIGNRVTRKRDPAGEHFVEHAAERPDITSLINGLTARLLRAHVGGRPENHTVAGVLWIQSGAVSICRFRQAEVEHFHGAIRRDLDVRRLQIPVHDTFLMGGLERIGNLPRDHEHLVRRQPRGGTSRPCGRGDSVGQRFAFDQFQYEAAHALGLFDAVDCADMRVIQCGEHPCFALETRAPFWISGERKGQDFDGDLAAERVVVRTVHLTHPAHAQQGSDGVRAEALADESMIRSIPQRGLSECWGRDAHEPLGASLLGKQRFDFTSQHAIARTGRAQKRRALTDGSFQRGVTQVLDLPPAVSGHSRWPPPSSRSNHSFAIFQSRLTVSREMCNASAVSSTVRPPKNRISTT